MEILHNIFRIVWYVNFLLATYWKTDDLQFAMQDNGAKTVF